MACDVAILLTWCKLLVLTNIKSRKNIDFNLDLETQTKYHFKIFYLKSKFKLESSIDLDLETQTKYK